MTHLLSCKYLQPILKFYDLPKTATMSHFALLTEGSTDVSELDQMA